MRTQKRHRVGAVADRCAKRIGDGIGGDVVMRWANAARGEKVVILAAKGAHGGDNGGMIIGHDARFAQRNAVAGQFA